MVVKGVKGYGLCGGSRECFKHLYGALIKCPNTLQPGQKEVLPGL
jgi:hypothetical protein